MLVLVLGILCSNDNDDNRSDDDDDNDSNDDINVDDAENITINSFFNIGKVNWTLEWQTQKYLTLSKQAQNQFLVFR